MPAVALDNMSSENEITYDVSTEPMRRGRELSYVWKLPRGVATL